jgi:hypothetical protein
MLQIVASSHPSPLFGSSIHAANISNAKSQSANGNMLKLHDYSTPLENFQD